MSFKFIMKLSIATIVTILIINTLFFYNSKNENEKLFLNVSNQITNQTAQALKVWIDDQIRVVDTISKEKKIIDLCLNPEDQEKIKDAQDYLEEVHQRYPYYENLPIALKLDKPIYRELDDKKIKIYDGHFIIDTVNLDVIGKGGLEYSYIKEIFEGKEYFISEIYPSIYRKNPIFVISKPIKYNEKIIGVAIVSPQIDHFTEFFIDNIKIGKTGYMFFLDERGAVIAHPNRNYVLSETKDVKGITKKILNDRSSKNNHFKDNLIGVKKLYTLKKVDLKEYNIKYDWYIFFTQNLDEVYSPTYKSMLMLGFVILLLISSLAGLIIIVSDWHYKKEKEKELLDLNMNLEFLVEERTKELKLMANTDGLTNLCNKKYLNRNLKKSIESVKLDYKELSVAICDIDDFKKVNDRFGHLVGDDVIRAVADTLKRVVPKNDIVGRYGGEEFLIIFNNTNFKDAINICEKIRFEIENLDLEISELSITISIGIYLWDKQNSAELVKAADDLLYKAKASGKNQVCHKL